MIKLFSYPEYEDIDEIINDWLKKNEVTKYEVFFAPTVTDNELRYNILLNYSL